MDMLSSTLQKRHQITRRCCSRCWPTARSCKKVTKAKYNHIVRFAHTFGCVCGMCSHTPLKRPSYTATGLIAVCWACAIITGVWMMDVPQLQSFILEIKPSRTDSVSFRVAPHICRSNRKHRVLTFDLPELSFKFRLLLCVEGKSGLTQIYPPFESLIMFCIFCSQK